VNADGFEATDQESGSEHDVERNAGLSTPIASSLPLPATEFAPTISPSAISDRDRDTGIETEVEGDQALAQSPSAPRQIHGISYELLSRLTVPPLTLELGVADSPFDGLSGSTDRRSIPLSATSGCTNQISPLWHEGDYENDNKGREVSRDEAMAMDHLTGQVSHWSVGDSDQLAGFRSIRRSRNNEWRSPSD
jgi:hypothetical protein